MKIRNLLIVLGVVLVAALPGIVAAQDADEMEPIELPAVDPLAVTGDIITAGSSTVFPLTSAMAERFEEDGYTGTITIDSIGSGAGYERFCVNAETDIANASRPIRDSEVEACAANGREALEFRVGTDALAVVVSVENDFVENLTIAELGAIFAGEYTSWDQVNPDYPAVEITLFSPGTDSGTYDYFVEEVLQAYAEAQGVAEDEIGDAANEFILSVSGIQFSENDNVLVEGVAGSPGAIGYFGFAYYLENADVVRAVSVEDVEPNGETAENGEYPLARPLFIYSSASIMEEKPQVAEFINYYLTYVNEEVIEAGYFPASVEALNNAKKAWMEAMGMEVEAE